LVARPKISIFNTRDHIILVVGRTDVIDVHILHRSPPKPM